MTVCGSGPAVRTIETGRKRYSVPRKMIRAAPLLAFLFPFARLASQAAPDHSVTSKTWWLSGQVNVIYQWHEPFPAAYTGPHSLRPVLENATSTVATVYSGLRLGRRVELLFDLESAGGHGISEAFGLAGFSNLDVVRNPTLGAGPYVARALIRSTFALSSQTEAPSLPVRRLTIAFGKFGVVDFFDLNGPGSDSHLQFLNWTIDNSGAYDYAADTRGYTIGGLAELRDGRWALRWAETLMPAVANGIKYDWHVDHAHADNVEIELDRGILPHHDGAIRLLGFLNHATMGSYEEALDAFAAGTDSVLDVAAHRRMGRIKRGVSVSLEQGIGRGIDIFARAGRNDGGVESFAYTEVDRSTELGAAWVARSERNRAGLAFARNGIGMPHRLYLARGGLGFLLGDGALNYGAEQIVEGYFTRMVIAGFSLAADVQHIVHPGYNRDRGPVTIFAIRAHLDVPGK